MEGEVADTLDWSLAKRTALMQAFALTFAPVAFNEANINVSWEFIYLFGCAENTQNGTGAVRPPVLLIPKPVKHDFFIFFFHLRLAFLPASVNFRCPDTVA